MLVGTSLKGLSRYSIQDSQKPLKCTIESVHHETISVHSLNNVAHNVLNWKSQHIFPSVPKFNNLFHAPKAMLHAPSFWNFHATLMISYEGSARSCRAWIDRGLRLRA